MAHAGTPFLTQPEMIQATCHCGAVSLEIDQRPASLTECNCSVCRRYAGQWAYYTRPQVRVRCPPGTVAAYVWGDRMIEFYHCTTCGCLTHYEAVEKTSDSRIAVNARMMDPADLAGVRVRKLDGASTWKYLHE